LIAIEVASGLPSSSCAVKVIVVAASVNAAERVIPNGVKTRETRTMLLKMCPEIECEAGAKG